MAVMPTRSASWFKSNGSIFSSTMVICQSDGVRAATFSRPRQGIRKKNLSPIRLFFESGEMSNNFFMGSFSVYAMRPQALNGGKIAPQRPDGTLFTQAFDQAGVGRLRITDNPAGRVPGKFLELSKEILHHQTRREIISGREQIGFLVNASFRN